MKAELIEEGIRQRQEEIDLYEVNIFNFEHMIAAISDDDVDGMLKFRGELADRLASERLECRKAKMVLEALRSQQASLTG